MESKYQTAYRNAIYWRNEILNCGRENPEEAEEYQRKMFHFVDIMLKEKPLTTTKQ